MCAAESTVVMAQTAIGVAVVLGTAVPVSGCHHRSKVRSVFVLLILNLLATLQIQSDLSRVLKDWRVDDILCTNKFRTFALLLDATNFRENL